MITPFSDDELMQIGQDLEEFHEVFYVFWTLASINFDDSVPTAYVRFPREKGGKATMGVNPKFWAKLSPRTKLWIICHECLHVLLDHGIRNGMQVPGATWELVNKAQDITINEITTELFGFEQDQIDDWQKYCWIETCFEYPALVARGQNFIYYLKMLVKEPPKPKQKPPTPPPSPNPPPGNTKPPAEDDDGEGGGESPEGAPAGNEPGALPGDKPGDQPGKPGEGEGDQPGEGGEGDQPGEGEGGAGEAEGEGEGSPSDEPTDEVGASSKGEPSEEPAEGPVTVDEHYHDQGDENANQQESRQEMGEKLIESLTPEELQRIMDMLKAGDPGGLLPGSLLPGIEAMMEKFKRPPKLNVTKLIGHLKKTRFKRKDNDKETFTHEQRRFQGLDLGGAVLPGINVGKKNSKDRLLATLFMDVSGSCMEHFKTFSKIFAAFEREKEYFELLPFVFDTSTRPIVKDEALRIGGGTSFIILEEKLQSLKAEGHKYPDVVIVVTDGYGDKVKPQIPSRWIWLLTPDHSKADIPKESRSFMINNVTF